jgi:Cdc6-like AAA superfamily ATPase
MNWEQYKSVMERNAIKTDDMATEDAYFMATHMPFSRLAVYEGGRTQSAPKMYSEEEIFTRLVCNPNNEHRMIIVRGDNGTGKSHLIRFLKAKLESSPATVYNPATEQLIFLRRLNNSVRGVFSQLIDQDVIKDATVRQKIQKFIDSSDSKDEAAFLTDILYSYIAAVSSDQTSDTYKPVICRDIASYLSDSRVKEHLLREGGAISRCYTVITAPSNQVLKTTEVFTDDDFDVRKIITAVIKQGDPQASDFASTIKGDKDEIHKLVNYLNHFTSEVVKRCADISSESTKAVFEQLRKDLKKQGKNLTLFIEDFTGFTGIDSELITVLSTEHGGDYADLCRVTSIIGITNDYYDQFRDNFTDRVTHQISVTDDSFGTAEFLTQMAGRYINAIYCDPTALRTWNDQGASLDAMPINSFTPPCEWDSVKIGIHETTLYPFNKKSIIALYESLPVKSPRMFLKEVIRAQLKEYFDGKIYGDPSYFPLNPGNVQMSKDPHSSAIDRIESLSVDDRARLKAIFALWGDGSASGIRESNGTIRFGGINKLFFDDIGLGAFEGIGDLKADKPASGGSSGAKTTPKSEPPKRIDEATKSYQKYKSDINDWFTKNEPLKFDPDYRTWLKDLIKGTATQGGAINWQDIGIPGYIAEQRLSDLGVYFITDQSTPINADRAIVLMDRSTLSRDALLALNELKYYKGWDFEGAAYYQQRLITWLEREKPSIIERVTASKTNEPALPVIEWCLVLQYLKAKIYGVKLDCTNKYTLLNSLMADFTFKSNDKNSKRETKEWDDLIQFVQNRKSEFDSARSLLSRSVSTTQGAVHYAVDSKNPSCIRTDELLIILEKLTACNWDIEKELPLDIPDKHLLYNQAALLKKLYPSVAKVVKAEAEKAKLVSSKIQEYVGDINEENLLLALNAIQNLFSVFASNGIIGSNDIRTKYEAQPIDTAKGILKCVDLLRKADGQPSNAQKLDGYSQNQLHTLADFLRDLQSIAQVAEKEEATAKKELAKIGGIDGIDALSEAALESMKNLYEFVEAMEVSNVTD